MVRINQVWKEYGSGKVGALQDISLHITPKEFVMIMGQSGSGKSTLLNLIGGLDRPSSGSIFVKGEAMNRLSEDQRTLLRRREIGLIFQFFNLFPTLTVKENVSLPLFLKGQKRRSISEKVDVMIERVRLTDRADHLPSQLSGGEMQRVAIARALVMHPSILLADEPTGNLDSKMSEEILGLIQKTAQDLTVIMVTHNEKIAQKYGTRVIVLQDGKIDSDSQGDNDSTP
jgi:putative ABC transport system ATP-binding protein